MAQVHNPSADSVEVPLFSLHFTPGETKEVPDEEAAQLGAPLVTNSAITQAEADLAKAQAEVAAATAANGGNS